jgi:hypothetical protein
MPLFEFELADVGHILPFGSDEKRRLSWFALTDGWFHIRVGDQALFEYTQEVVSHRGGSTAPAYYVAAHTRAVLEILAAAVSSVPREMEMLVGNGQQLIELQKWEDGEDDSDEALDLHHAAWCWLKERSLHTSFLKANPQVHFVRVRNELRIHWDNRGRVIDGVPVWTAQYGMHALAVTEFVDESRLLVERLMNAMRERVARIDAKEERAQVALNVESLRQEHETWREEFESYFHDYQPEVSWPEAVQALRTVVARKGVRL